MCLVTLSYRRWPHSILSCQILTWERVMVNLDSIIEKKWILMKTIHHLTTMVWIQSCNCGRYTPCGDYDQFKIVDYLEHSVDQNIDNSETLHQKIVVMLVSYYISSQLEPNDSIYIETPPKGIISNSLFQRDEICYLLILFKHDQSLWLVYMIHLVLS